MSLAERTMQEGREKEDKNQYKMVVGGEKANRVENTEWRVQLWDEERVK